GACRKCEPTCVQRDKGELESLPFSPENAFTGDAHVREVNDAILDGLEAHEAAAMHDFDAGPRRLDDERRDLLARLSIDDGVGRCRHDDEQLGARSVRAPQLLAVQYVAASVVTRLRVRVHVRGIRAGVDFGERERADGALRETRKESLLLLVAAKQFQRLGQTYGLMRGQKR